MDGDPATFMFDCEGNRIRYLLYDYALYLHSPGEDKVFDPVQMIREQGGSSEDGGRYLGDDTLLSVARLKRPKLLPEAPGTISR